MRLVPSTPERIAIIQRIFRESVEDGRGYRTIANGLNADGISSPRDGNWSKNTRARWSVGSVRSILRNPAYTGDSVWNRRTFAKFHRIQGGTAVQRPRQEADKPRENDEAEWIVVRDTHEPIIPAATYRRAQELMKLRGRNRGPRNFRVGSGLRSPYLLSGLLRCDRCGHCYQGRTINAAKRRTDGSKIQTFYYACGGYVMKGTATCEKFLLEKEPLERFVKERISERVRSLTDGEGEALLRRFIGEEKAAQDGPRREAARLRARIAVIDRKADTLLEEFTEETRGFVNTKLRDLATEKRGLQDRIQELESASSDPIDANAFLQAGLEKIRDLPARTHCRTLAARKEFVHDLIDGVTVFPDERRLEVRIRKIPASIVPRSGLLSVRLVAGAGLESVQTELLPRRQGHSRGRFRSPTGGQGADQRQESGPLAPSGILTEVTKALSSSAESTLRPAVASRCSVHPARSGRKPCRFPGSSGPWRPQETASDSRGTPFSGTSSNRGALFRGFLQT